ncbi:ThiF family adenylyltransferase [candidate division KSB1 bacterium]|nr:ThiF family adenylyltransferase [candidate division KSB1 bacterium]
MTDDRFLRQSDVLDASKVSQLGITLIGLGSIGSVTGLALAKLGVVGLTAYDADFVESHNWSNQMYSDSDIGSLKATAFTMLLETYGGQTPNAVPARFAEQTLTEIVISAVDSMESRKLIWRAVREQSQMRLYIDSRMGLETLDVHVVRPQIREDRVRYSATLVSDAETLQESCTARSVCYTPLMAASIICNLIRRYVNDEQLPSRVILDLATFTLLTIPQ